MKYLKIYKKEELWFLTVLLASAVLQVMTPRFLSGFREHALDYYNAGNEERRKAMVKDSLFGNMVHFGVEMASAASMILSAGGGGANGLKPFQALQVEGLSCVYADGRGVRNVDFEVRAGEVLLIRGEAASSKSSVIYAMTGIMGRDSGSVKWNGQEVDEPCEVFKAPFVGVALQDGNLLNASIRFCI